MEKRYFVKSLKISGKGKNVYPNGTEVFDKNFPPGRLAQLVKEKHVRVEESELKSEIKKLDDTSSQTNLLDFEKTPIDQISEKQLRKILKNNDVQYEPEASKEALYDLYLKIGS